MSRILDEAPVLLAVDTAKSSGWCLLQGGKHIDSGQCDAFTDEPRRVCQLAIALDPRAELVLERAFGGNLSTLTGLGAARGCWLSAWRWATGKKTTARVRSVLPQTWRCELFGLGGIPASGAAHSAARKRRDAHSPRPRRRDLHREVCGRSSKRASNEDEHTGRGVMNAEEIAEIARAELDAYAAKHNLHASSLRELVGQRVLQARALEVAWNALESAQ